MAALYSAMIPPKDSTNTPITAMNYSCNSAASLILATIAQHDAMRTLYDSAATLSLTMNTQYHAMKTLNESAGTLNDSAETLNESAGFELRFLIGGFLIC